MPSMDLPISSNIIKPIQYKEEKEIVHEKNPNGSFYIGTPSNEMSWTNYRFVKDYYVVLKSAINANDFLSKSIDNIKILKDNKDTIIRMIVSNKDIHNYITLLQNDRNLPDEELEKMFKNISYYLFEIKRYTNNGFRLIDFCIREDVERFEESFTAVAYSSCKTYLDSIYLSPSDILVSDILEMGYITYLSDMHTETVSDFAEMFLSDGYVE